MPPEEKSSLEKLQERLYSPVQDVPPRAPNVGMRAPQAPASVPPPASPPISQQWAPPPPPPPKPPRKKLSLAIWFLIAALVFAIVAIGISAAFLFTGGRDVSSDKITITVTGPTTIASGTPVPLTVAIQNHNPAAITDATLELDFPDGTRSAADVTQPLVRYTNTLAAVASGAAANQTVQAVLFGSANQSVTVPVTLTYHTANSNTVFTKKQNYTFTITSSPLSITTNTLKTVASGQPFTITVAVRSNATTPLTNIAVAAQYPAGFTPSAAGTSTSLFTLGDLQPGVEKDLSISGTLAGSNGDQKSFEFTVGVATSTNGTPTIAPAYASAESQITVSKPFLEASLSLNNADTDPLVVSSGSSIAGAVSWVNTLTSGLSNAQVIVHLSGNALAPATVTAFNGFFNSANSSVIFNKDGEAGLAHLNAGDTGNGSFSMGLKSGTAFTTLRDPAIQVAVGVSGTPDGANAPEAIASSFTRTIQVATDLVLTSQLLHSSGAFANSGPLPPQPNVPTTYTVALAVTNDVSSVAGATATMILPSYVTFTGKTSTASGSITYDDASRTVTWQIGDVPAGTTKPITGSFQVSFLPSSSQSGSSPIIVQNQTLTGVDRFTQTNVGNTASALTTQTSGDAGYTAAFGTVAN